MRKQDRGASVAQLTWLSLPGYPVNRQSRPPGLGWEAPRASCQDQPKHLCAQLGTQCLVPQTWEGDQIVASGQTNLLGASAWF